MLNNPASEHREAMNRKPVLWRNARTVLNTKSLQFEEKLLCDGIVFNLGDACAYSCRFCYVSTSQRYHAPPLIKTHNKACGTVRRFQDVVIRRKSALDLLRSQLLKKDGRPRFVDPADRRVAYSSTLVDAAANMELLHETAEACNLILDHTSWDIRLLTKSNLLHKLVADRLIPDRHHQRLIFGFSTGTLDDRVAAAIEHGTAKVSKRIKSLHWLQDRGLRTFGMICPSLPQDDYDRFSRDACAAIRAERCEHVWAEVINLRGLSLTRTIDGLKQAGLDEDADRLQSVCGKDGAERWEEYARKTFMAHVKHIPGDKLRFLQYVTPSSAEWWASHKPEGAVCLGKSAVIADAPVATEELKPCAGTAAVVSGHAESDEQYLAYREKIVSLGIKATIATAKALFEIHSYGDGRLWKTGHPTFESYCRARWDLKKSQAYRLVECGKFVAALEAAGQTGDSPFGEKLPKNEGQIRPLMTLPEEYRLECWNRIVGDAASSELTAREVGTKVREFAVERGLPGFASAKQKGDKAVAAAKPLDSLRKIAMGHANRERISALVDEIEALLG
jgi:DNA repair photolyase